MKIYLDMCCYNRPYDPQEQLKIHLETEAKLHLQEQIKDGKIVLVSSYTLDYELGNVPQKERKETIQQFISEYASEYVGPEYHKIVEEKADEIMRTGVKEKDAAHVASAILAGCDYFISTDKRLLKYSSPMIKLLNPLELIGELEGEE